MMAKREVDIITTTTTTTKHTPIVSHGTDIADSVYILDDYVHNCLRPSLDCHLRLIEEDAQDKDYTFVQGPPQFDSACIHRHCIGSASLSIGTNHLRQRSLTDALAVRPYDEMTAFITEAPGSPPGLSGSKSSKSSSNHSSSLSGADGILSDITHFEDIGLDEDHSFQRNLHGMEKLSRPPPRTSATTTSGHRTNAAAMSSRREMVGSGYRPSFVGMAPSSKSRVATHSLSLPKEGGFMRRGYRNASTPSLAITAMSNCNRSRSPSPNPTSPLAKPMPSPRSPRRPGLAPVNINLPPVRKGSWQPKRKTVKELEAEYNDEDEDLPDETSLWNVPLSPRPATERSPISAAASPRPSPRVSPERASADRPSPLRTFLNISSPYSPQAASVMTSGSALSPSLCSPPSSPRKLVRGASTGMMPDHVGFGRSKSWNVALSELSEEAKILTETLENHALTVERAQEEAVQNGSVSQQTLEKLSRSKTSSVELPPLRMNNVMIDPLPISKEKEAVLSRTRPSWLPPKAKKEEQKHLKEYQRMMERHKEAEMRKAAAQADSKCVKDDTKSALLRIWEEHVLPNWEQVIREPRTRELWWRGVAPKSRAKVWEKAIGNELALTEVTYKKALQRAKDIESRIALGGAGEEHRKEKTWFNAIRRDVKVTFPELSVFQPGAPLHDGLVDVLMAYSMYRSDVGYSHGTHVSPSHQFPRPPPFLFRRGFSEADK